MNRGAISDEVKEKSKELLGYEIEKDELRLMPYLQYRLLNHGELDPAHLNGVERKILKKWRDGGHIEGGITKDSLRIEKKFWDIICELIFVAYVKADGKA